MLERADIALICQMLVTLMFLGSFVVGYYNLRIFQQANTSQRIRELLDDFSKMVDEGLLEDYPADLEKWKEAMLNTDYSPLTFYYTQLPTVAKIGQFYETVGLMVRKNLIDFNVLFELLPFPDRFWADTHEFRITMRKVTYYDFWYNFGLLHDKYMESRKRINVRARLQDLLLKKRPATPKSPS